MKEVLLTLRSAAHCLFFDGLFDVAKGAAFSGILCFFPVLTSLATVLVQLNAQRVSRAISKFLFEVVPPGTEDLVQYAFTSKGSRPGLLLFGAIVLSLWAASDLVVTLMQGFQAAYRSPNRRTFWHQRWVAMMLVFSSLLPAILAALLLVMSSGIEVFVLRLAGLSNNYSDWEFAWTFLARTLSFALSLGMLTVAIAGLYHYGPSLTKGWRRVWPGAFLATILASLATLGFGWYVRNISTYNIMYGSIGAPIALMIWMYLLSLIALFGCAYNASAERLRQQRHLT
ncbi:MAG: YihY/virulence factor BrkB family protein [Bryobacter sp.]